MSITECLKQLALFLTLVQSPADINAVAAKQVSSPGIPGVIQAGTKPIVLATGLDGADDPIAWAEGELIFSEPTANRLLRVDRKGTISTFIDKLHEPRGLAVDSRGRLISLQAQEGFTSIRVIYPAGSAAVIAEKFEGTSFS